MVLADCIAMGPHELPEKKPRQRLGRSSGTLRKALVQWLGTPCSPEQLRASKRVKVGVSEIHDSHSMEWIEEMGIWICNACRFYAGEVVSSRLQDTCMKAKNRAGKQNLARVDKGLFSR